MNARNNGLASLCGRQRLRSRYNAAIPGSVPLPFFDQPARRRRLHQLHRPELTS